MEENNLILDFYFKLWYILYMKEKRCFSCGKGLRSLENIKGQEFPYLNIAKLKLTRDFYAEKCDKCGDFSLRAGECKKLDRQLVLSLCDFYLENKKEENEK